MKYDNTLITIPMDSRSMASSTGPDDFAFYREGGSSWTAPYVAGLFALACQVNPDVTREKFWEAALKTAVIARPKENGSERDFGKIINPRALIEELSEKRPRADRDSPFPDGKDSPSLAAALRYPNSR